MVQGIERLQRRLVNEIPKKVRAALEVAMVEAADLVVRGAQLRVPVDTGELKGTIRRNNVSETKRGGLKISVTAGDKNTIEETYQKARLLEFGTQKMPSQPFLLPAYRANKRRIRGRLRKAMRDAIKEG